MKKMVLLMTLFLMSVAAFAQDSDVRHECVQKIAEFYGVELNGRKVLDGINGDKKCQLTIEYTRNTSGINNEEVNSAILFLNRESEFQPGQLMKSIWAMLNDNDELSRIHVKTCEIKGDELVLDYHVKSLSGWRKNHRYVVQASKSSIQITEKEWGLWTSGAKTVDSCQF